MHYSTHVTCEADLLPRAVDTCKHGVPTLTYHLKWKKEIPPTFTSINRPVTDHALETTLRAAKENRTLRQPVIYRLQLRNPVGSSDVCAPFENFTLFP